MNIKNIIYSFTAVISLAASLAACGGDWERPPMIEPEAADIDKVNTTILALKKMVWEDGRNYVTEVGRNQGEDIYIMGRIISTDHSGNIYKTIVIQDNTAAIAIAVNESNLYKSYMQGQQLVMKLTGAKMGGYNGLLQVGDEGTYGGSPSITFMDSESFNSRAQLNGLPRLERIDTLTVTIPDLITARESAEELQKLQSRMVRIDKVKFSKPDLPFAGNSSTDRYITDSQGNQLCMRNNSYSSFAKNLLPSGTGSITGILSYYGNDWQLLLNDLDGLQGFDPVMPGDPSNPGSEFTGDGTADNPFTVPDILEGAKSDGAWVTGYIVGTVTDKSFDSAVLGLTNAVLTNVIIAEKPDETDITRCVPVQLPAGDIRSKVNLVTNPGNYKALATLRGNIDTYFSVVGLKAVTEAVIEGGTEQPETPVAPGTQYTTATQVTPGAEYLIVADGKCAKPISGNYGYIQVADVTVNDNTVTTEGNYTFTFETSDNGYYIRQADGRYLYMTGTNNSFNLTESPSEEAVWTVAFNGTTTRITNKSTGKTIQLDAKYGTYGAYTDVRGTYPALYEKL